MGKGDIFIQAILYLQFIYPQYIKMTKRDLTPDSVHSFLKTKKKLNCTVILIFCIQYAILTQDVLSQFAIVCPAIKNVDQNMLNHKTYQKIFFFSLLLNTKFKIHKQFESVSFH